MSTYVLTVQFRILTLCLNYWVWNLTLQTFTCQPGFNYTIQNTTLLTRCMRKLLDVNSHSSFPAKVYFLIKWTDKSIGYKQTAILKLLRALENAAMLTTAHQSSRIITWLLSRMVTSRCKRCRGLCAVGRLGRKKKKARAIARSLRTAAISRALSIFSIIITIKKLSNLIGYQLSWFQP